MVRAAAAVGAALFMLRLLVSRKARLNLQGTVATLAETNTCLDTVFRQIGYLHSEQYRRHSRLRAMNARRRGYPLRLRGLGFFQRQQLNRDIAREFGRFPKIRRRRAVAKINLMNKMRRIDRRSRAQAGITEYSPKP
jgi:hypothetical protein